MSSIKKELDDTLFTLFPLIVPYNGLFSPEDELELPLDVENFKLKPTLSLCIILLFISLYSNWFFFSKVHYITKPPPQKGMCPVKDRKVSEEMTRKLVWALYVISLSLFGSDQKYPWKKIHNGKMIRMMSMRSEIYIFLLLQRFTWKKACMHACNIIYGYGRLMMLRDDLLCCCVFVTVEQSGAHYWSLTTEESTPWAHSCKEMDVDNMYKMNCRERKKGWMS